MHKLICILFLLSPLFSIGQTDTVIHLYTFGGNENDNAEEVKATHDGGFIVIGSTSSNSSGNTDAYLLKIDSLCNYEWSTALGGINNDWGYSVKQTLDKGYIIAASSNSYGNNGYDAVLMKRDSLGNNVWQKSYGGADWDFAYSVVQTYDSGFVFCGETYNNTNGFSDVFIVKTNPLGDTLWTKTIGGALKDKGNCIIETSDSNIVVAGITNTSTDSTEMYIIKLTSNGILLWDSIYGGPLYETANNIIETYNGNFVIVGATSSLSLGGDQDYLVKSISSNGIFQWDFTILNNAIPTPDDEELFDVYELDNFHLLVTGYTKTGGNNKNIGFIELNSTGGWTGHATVINNNDDDIVKSVAIGNNGNIVGAGSTYSFGAGNEDVLLVRLDTIYGGQLSNENSFVDNTPLAILNNNLTENNIVVYPNPTHDAVSILSPAKINNVYIYDVLGKLVYSTSSYQNQIDISNLTGGLYFFEIEIESHQKNRIKIIKHD